jgi:hypothetical protein
MATAHTSQWTTSINFIQEEGMLSAISKTAIAATTALIIGLAPIATADLAFARGMGGGGGMRVGGGGGFGGGHFGGGLNGSHFAGGMVGVSHFSGSMVGSRFSEAHFAGGSRFSEAHFAGGARFAHNDFDRGFHRGFRHRRFVALGGFAAGYDGYCDDPYNYPYPPYGPYGYNYCY